MADNTTLEGLEFQIEAPSDKAVKGIDALAKSLETLKKATSGKNGLGTLSKQLEGLNKSLSSFHNEKLESLSNALSAIKGLGDVNISPDIAKRINQIAKATGNISLSSVENLEDLTKALRELNDLQLPSRITIPRVVQTGGQGTPNTVDPATTENAEAVDSTVNHVEAATESATQSASRLKSVLSGIGGVFRKSFSVGTGALKSMGSALGKVGSAGKSAVKAMTALPRLMGERFASQVKNSTSALGGFLSSIKRIALYRAVRAIISSFTKGLKEGISNLYQYSALMGGSFAGSMNSLATSAQYLKNSLGAMAAPILQALAPAIDFVAEKIVYLLNLINMLFARLMGKSTTTVAKKVSKNFADVGSSAGKASDAAKELKKSILGFDELNVMADNSNKGSNGGSGAGGTDFGSMFEEVPIDKGVSEFADKLKEAFEAGDWKELGTLLGNKVNEVIDMVNWGGIGKKIGYAINGAVQTAYWFLDTVNFTKIGQHLAELLNNALAEIDFEFVGRLMVKPFTSLANLIIGFITTLDWGLVAKSVSDCVKGIFKECSKWLDSVDWTGLGKALWKDIKDVFTNIDYAGLASSFFTFLGKAIRSAVRFLAGFFGSIAEDIKNWWNKDIKGADWKETGANLLKAIGKGIVGIGKFVLDYIVKPFCEALFDTDWEEIKEVGENIVKGIFKGITDFFKGIADWIDEHIVTPFVDAIKDLFGIHSPSTVMAEIGEFIAEGLLQGILKPLKNLARWIDKNIVQPITKAFDKIGLIVETGVALTKEGWDTLSGWVGEIGEKAVKLIRSGWRTLSSWVGEVGTKTVRLVQSGWTTLREWVGEIGAKAFALAKDGWTTISNFVGNIGSKAFALAKDGWSTISNFVGNIGSKAFSLAKSGWTTVSNFVGEIGSKAFSLAKSGWTTISNFVGDIGSKAFSLAKSGWTTVSAYVGNIGSKAFSLAKDGWTTISNFVGNIGSKAFALAKDGWSTISNFVGNIGSKAFSLAKSGWTTVSNFVGEIGSKAFSLAKSGWTTISNFVGDIGSKAFSLAKSGWTTVSAYVGNIGSKAFSLAKSGWTSISNYVGNIGSKAFSLAKSGWSTVSSYVGNIGSKAFSLAKDGWTSLSSWVGSIGNKGVGLVKSGWTSLSSWVGTHVSVGISLFKSGWSSIKSFFGLANGGIVGARGGVKAFEHGGVIPAYANGAAPTVNHGSMFVAGEKGAEMVGHVNGRTEVMNRFQLASVMKTSVVEGMSLYGKYITGITSHLTTCANAISTGLIFNTDKVIAAINSQNLRVGEEYIAWMEALDSRSTSMFGDGSGEQFIDTLNEKLDRLTEKMDSQTRELSDQLETIAAKDTTVEVTTNSFTKALNRKNQRDGKVVVPVGV